MALVGGGLAVTGAGSIPCLWMCVALNLSLKSGVSFRKGRYKRNCGGGLALYLGVLGERYCRELLVAGTGRKRWERSVASGMCQGSGKCNPGCRDNDTLTVSVVTLTLTLCNDFRFGHCPIITADIPGWEGG